MTEMEAWRAGQLEDIGGGGDDVPCSKPILYVEKLMSCGWRSREVVMCEREVVVWAVGWKKEDLMGKQGEKKSVMAASPLTDEPQGWFCTNHDAAHSQPAGESGLPCRFPVPR